MSIKPVVSVWVRWNTTTKRIVDQAEHRHQIAEPSKGSDEIIIKLVGYKSNIRAVSENGP